MKVAAGQIWRSLRNDKRVVVLEVKEFESTYCAFIREGLYHKGRSRWVTCNEEATTIKGYRFEGERDGENV